MTGRCVDVAYCEVYYYMLYYGCRPLRQRRGLVQLSNDSLINYECETHRLRQREIRTVFRKGKNDRWYLTTVGKSGST